jgi:hypothetical protein
VEQRLSYQTPSSQRRNTRHILSDARRVNGDFEKRPST